MVSKDKDNKPKGMELKMLAAIGAIAWNVFCNVLFIFGGLFCGWAAIGFKGL